MNKQQQFIDWLCGKKVQFPFFKNPHYVKQPIGFKNSKEAEEIETDEEIRDREIEADSVKDAMDDSK